jgi:hypothetical protein
MKSVKLTRIMLALGCAAAFYACKKDDKTTTPVATPDSVYVLSKAYYYNGDSTAATPAYKDTVYYTNNRISRISGDYGTDTLDYDFTYNAAGKVSVMHVHSRHSAYESWDQHYYFFYRTGNKLDSIAEIDSSRWETSIFVKLQYDSANYLSGLKSYSRNSNTDLELFEWTNYTYYRTATHALDSISSTRFGSPAAYNYKFNVAAIDTSTQFADAYSLVMAQRTSFIFMASASRPNLNFQQFLNPTDNLFTSGTYAGQPFNTVLTKNGLGLFNSFMLKYTSLNGEAAINSTIKFGYTKVPKQ